MGISITSVAYAVTALLASIAYAASAPSGHWLPPPLPVNVLFSGMAFVATMQLIPSFRDIFIKARLFGIDLNKPDTKRDAEGNLIRPVQGPQVPEAMGVISGTVYLVVMFLFIPFPFIHDYLATIPPGSYTFRHDMLSKYVVGLLSICCMCFLGFADNVLDLRWRHKLVLPTAASLPLLMVYYVTDGTTVIMLPTLVASKLHIESVDIGVLYYVFMGSLAIFCTNAINILAGVNGLESGQSVVIGLTILCSNLIQLHRWPEGDLHHNNLFSLYLILPFLGTSLGLTYYNWFPSQVFVGDTYCYFAGMTFAVVGILGKFSKTLLLFFVPQVINFIYSIPQLFKLVPCPRHRMPAYLGKTNQVTMSFALFKKEELPKLGQLVYKVFKTLRVVYVEETAAADGTTDVKMSNLTIINYTLYLFGPMREDQLTIKLLTLQCVCSVLALVIRFHVAGLFYEIVQ